VTAFAISVVADSAGDRADNVGRVVVYIVVGVLMVALVIGIGVALLMGVVAVGDYIFNRPILIFAFLLGSIATVIVGYIAAVDGLMEIGGLLLIPAGFIAWMAFYKRFLE
jgi:hypothetical protein